ncbi:hypothetical protein BK133_04985 [Paenibacillus sp. FSL H8-0548]|uniref:S16 family serine protease n=1 Tax=Paenibacillus sp. FSL H8-0548 TaxID=1920422 RepID=UPI00096CF7F1|nr:S16 family serine protease [Paenibacillus sp. FSL H8-0548]OMF37413.1 hypothetical protein BK133_04985 [Paenibacillus sp. FSL H8-0548]
MQKQRSEIRRVVLYAVAAAVMMWVLLYAPTPYIVYEPGIAVPVRSMVAIEEGDQLGSGDFLLTAVKMIEPNFLLAIQSMWNSSREVHLKRDVLRGYTKEQYTARMSVNMLGSQNNAIEAAYRYAGLPYGTKTEGIIVSDVLAKGQEAAHYFEAGDQLLGINGSYRFSSVKDMLETLRNSSKGAPIEFNIERGSSSLSLVYPADAISSPLTDDELLEALGIQSLTELRSIEPADSNKTLHIAAGEIGGPSAGLVFALQSLDLLTEGDLSGGERIAATGTLTADGVVGPIGGMKQKIMIASQEGAQLFLVPAENYKSAVETVNSLKTEMVVASVSTLQEAMEQIEAFRAASVK